MMPDDSAAMEQLDHVLDAIVQRKPAMTIHLDPDLVTVAEQVHAFPFGIAPDRGFAQRLRASLLHAPAANARGVLAGPERNRFRVAAIPERSDRRRGMIELGAMAAVLIILAFGALAPRLNDLRQGTGSEAPALVGAPESGAVNPPRAGEGAAAGEVPDTARPVALLFIVDKSGSMSYDPLGGASKIEMVRVALRQSAETVPTGTQLGILVFNDQQQWLVPMTTIDGDPTRHAIATAINGLDAEGGTELYPALSAGFDAIKRADADVRHIVLLSDGKSRTGTRDQYQRLINDIAGEGITLSTIAMGADSDTDLLQFLAEQGNGRYHFSEKTVDIPQLALGEAQSATNETLILTGRPILTGMPDASVTPAPPPSLQNPWR
jgi:hypothetical protein